MDKQTWLIVCLGRENAGFLGWISCISGNELSHDTTGSLKTKGERDNVECDEVQGIIRVALTSENGSLDSGTIGDGLIGVDGSVEFLAIEDIRKYLPNHRNSRGSTDEYDFVDLPLGETRVLDHILNGLNATSEKVHAKLLELGSCDMDREILTISESFTIDVGLMGSRKNSLSFLALISQSREGSHIEGNIDASPLLEFSNTIVN